MLKKNKKIDADLNKITKKLFISKVTHPIIY